MTYYPKLLSTFFLNIAFLMASCQAKEILPDHVAVCKYVDFALSTLSPEDAINEIIRAQHFLGTLYPALKNDIQQSLAILAVRTAFEIEANNLFSKFTISTRAVLKSALQDMLRDNRIDDSDKKLCESLLADIYEEIPAVSQVELDDVRIRILSYKRSS